MKAHVLQHEAFEGIGSIGSWLKKKNAAIGYTYFFKDGVLPKLDDLDLLIIMGGSMSVNDEATLPWLKDEKKIIRDAVERKISVLGICLGAQLIANALGARVYKNSQKEIGWFDVEGISAKNAFCFPEKFTVFQWHGETFNLPAGAVHLAKSEGCENQAFQIGKNVIGLQFHLEMMKENVESISENCSNDLTPGKYVQSIEEMKNADPNVYIQTNHLMSEVLAYLI